MFTSRLSGERFHECPVNRVDPGIARIVTLAGDVQEGVMPRAGGLLGQPSYFVHAYRIVRATEGELLRLDEEEREAKRKADERRGGRGLLEVSGGIPPSVPARFTGRG